LECDKPQHQKLDDIDQAITNYKALKLKVAISELDLTMTGAGGGQLGRGQRGNATPPSPEALAGQADAYARLFALFVRHRDVIDRITFWGLNDARSWRRGQNPLVFDAANQRNRHCTPSSVHWRRLRAREKV
jgi:GH35 family endo-1,4-beta-xylanase